MTGRRDSRVKPPGQVMFRLRHSDSICFRFCAEGSAPEKANNCSSTVLPFGCGQMGLRGTKGRLTVTRQYTESETYPWRVASVEERKEVKSFDWRKRAGIVAYLMPRY